MLPMNTLTLDEIFHLGAVSVYIIRSVCNDIVLFQNCYKNLLGKVLSTSLDVRVVQHLIQVIGVLSAIFLRYLMIETKKIDVARMNLGENDVERTKRLRECDGHRRRLVFIMLILLVLTSVMLDATYKHPNGWIMASPVIAYGAP